MKKTTIILKLLIFITLSTSSANWSDRAKINAPYDGKRFYNYEPSPPKSLINLLKWRIKGTRAPWPEWIKTKILKLSKNTIPDPGFVLVNHSTILIHINGIHILTDPIWSERTSPVSWAGPKRVRNPSIDFNDLPKIDLVIISHNHYDHFDLPTIEMLQKEHSPLFLIGLGNGYLMDELGIPNYREMDWWEQVSFKNLKVNMVPAQHWSARGIFDRHETLWGGYVLESGDNQIYFAGDTAYSKIFKEIGMRFSNIKMSFLPIGAYEPRWFMKFNHVNPEEAVMIHKDINSKQSAGMHYGTFQLTDESIEQPLVDLKAAKLKHKLKDNDFLPTVFGKAYPILFE